MSSPSSNSRPSTRLPSIRSFIRLRERRKVDMPHPDGPINARTDRSGIVSAMFHSACLEPYQKFIPSTVNFVFSVLPLTPRPLSSRSVMIAEKLEVAARVVVSMRSLCEVARADDGGNILQADCVF